jgi:hypothetical protein
MDRISRIKTDHRISANRSRNWRTVRMGMDMTGG